MMKFLKYSVIALFVLMGGLVVLYITMAGGVSDRIEGKTARVLAGVNAALAQGQDVSAPLDMISQVRPLLVQRDIAGAEALLDKALAALGPAANVDPATIKPVELPVYSQPEQAAALFDESRRVQIIGYYGNAMEPFLSPDGEYLFFNNENSLQHDTNIFFAKKKEGNDHMFEYIGPVPGTFSAESDSAPSIDESGRFFFTSQRSYSQNLLSLYSGRYTPEGVAGVKIVSGDIAAARPGLINTDSEIARDGSALYFTRSAFLFGQSVPLSSDIAAAYFADGEYLVHPQTDVIMQEINTAALEYGPSLTADGREMYFTRASKTEAGEDSQRIMVAARESTNHAFAKPYLISTITGHVGGPFITSDAKSLYFHRMEGDNFVIYRAERKTQ